MDVVEDPPWTAFHIQQTDPPVTGASSPPVTNLHDGSRMSDIFVIASVSNIRSFMHSSSRIAAARNLRGKEAQGFIDFVDQVSSLLPRRGVIRLNMGCRP